MKKYMMIVKSNALLLEEKEALLIPMQFDENDIAGKDKKEIHKAMIRDAMKLYPQYADKKLKPTFTIHDLSDEEYEIWVKTGVYEQLSMLKE